MNVQKQTKIIVGVAILLISFLLGCLLLADGRDQSSPLRVLVDIEYQGLGGRSRLDLVMENLAFSLKESAGFEDVEFEFLPIEGAEREAELDRLRTEIMAGGGPDVYIIRSDGVESALPTETAVFQMPEKAMELGMFLPLDEYIENAQFAEWNKFTSTLLDAGRNEEGLQLIPITYYVRSVLYPVNEFEHIPSKTMTWNEMLNNAELFDTAAMLGDGMQLEFNEYPVIDFHLDYILGSLADYQEEKLLFTEEELQQHVEEVFMLYDHTLEKNLLEQTGWSERNLGYGFTNTEIMPRMQVNGVYEEDMVTIVPFYSDDGGTTAIVVTYAAVNRNTRRPEDAFTVIDMLLRTKEQQNSELYVDWLYGGTRGAMPIHEELMNSEHPIFVGNARPIDGYCLSDENFETLCQVRDSITNVQFVNSLNHILQLMMLECAQARENGEDYTKIVSETYNTMRQMINE